MNITFNLSLERNKVSAFEHFPTPPPLCLICHTADDKPCVLLPVDGTWVEYGGGHAREQALPIHIECLLSGLRIMPCDHQPVHLFYLLAHHPPQKSTP